MSQILTGRDWSARMITPPMELGTAPLFRKEVVLDAGHGAVVSAGLRISSLGIFEARLNGRPVGDDVLSPGWSAYEWRLRYRTYDVTSLLEDTTVLTVAVGNGWYRGRLGFMGARALYGDRLGVIAELEITFADGHRQRVETDRSWTAGGSDVLADDLYDGQTIDARQAFRGLVHPRGPAGGVPPRQDPRLRDEPAGAVPRTGGDPAGDAATGAGLALAVRPHAGRLRTEPGRLAAVHGQGSGRRRDPDPARRGARARGAGRPAAPRRPGHRSLHPQRGRRLLRADDDVPRLPVRRGHGLAQRHLRRAHRGLPGGGGRALRPAADRDLRVLRPPAQPAPPQRRLGDEGQLPRRAHRLPPAQRAARLDRGHRGLRALGGLPVRRGPVPVGLARRPGARAVRGRRDGPLRRPRHPQAPARTRGLPRPRQHRDLVRRRGVGALGAVAGVRRPSGPRAAVRLDDRPRTPGGDAALADGTLGHLVPVRRLARSRRSAGRARGGEGRHRRRRHRLLPPLRSRSWRRRPSCSGTRPTRPSSGPWRDAPATPSTSTTSPATAWCGPTARPCTRWRSSSGSWTRRPRPPPASGSPSSWPRAATGCRPGSPARRTSPTRSPGPDISTTPTACCWSGSARPGCTP